MSVQFGRWNLNGKPVDAGYLEQVEAALNSYGPDGRGSYTNKNISILYYAFHTTKESRSEVQPHLCASGALITWDGRLDNRADLVRLLQDPLTFDSTDLAIVASAYEKWGTDCFDKLIGDWALSIWNPIEQSVLLAKDPMGTRHLYFISDRDEIVWGTVLEPLVRFGERRFDLNEEYVAGWFSMFPNPHLTPCRTVHSVSPSSFVLLRAGRQSVNRYWDFDPEKQIRYRTDSEYEEHFRTVFATAVQRRLRSHRPVLAELSGGRDSSSIVCMADAVIESGAAETPRLDTLSYFDDSEPNWNERLYFTKVEQKRGRTGTHIDINPERTSEAQRQAGSAGQQLLPVTNQVGCSSPEFRSCLAYQGNRVVLSGIGGDEVMGGVPTPSPELRDLLATAQYCALAHKLELWALERRRPWIHLLWDASSGFFPPALLCKKVMETAPWFRKDFITRHSAALNGYPSRIRFFGPLPSLQENLLTLDALRRQLAHTTWEFESPFEKRYPYLDRDLLEFLFAMPREQLVRPKQRRSLMRRALAGIVPEVILNRPTKGFVARGFRVAIQNDWTELQRLTDNMLSASLGYVTTERVLAALCKARSGTPVNIIALKRTIFIEYWLRTLRSFGVVNLCSA